MKRAASAPSLVALGLVALVLGIHAGRTTAQEEAPDLLSKMIWDMFQMRQGKTLCMAEATPLSAVRANVAGHLRRVGNASDPSPQAVATALWTLYPCPFSPFRPELRLATRQDIQGVWLFPEGSQKLRSRVRLGRSLPPTANARCDAVGYYPDGELRLAFGGDACPFEKAADLDRTERGISHLNWALLREGRVRITPPEGPELTEEWDVFAVETPFQVDNVQFKAGDLVTYVRREKGNEVNAATQFRHLQRLQ